MRGRAFASIALLVAGIFSSVQAKSEPGAYPNFSGAGVHGNPGVFTQYGDWGYVEFGGGAGTLKLDIAATTAVGERLQLLADSTTTTGGQGSSESITLRLALPLEWGFNVGADASTTFSSLGNSSNGRVGVVHASNPGGTLLRVGVQHDIGGRQTTFGGEARFEAGPVELTGAASVDAVLSGKSGYAGQRVGVQLKAGDNVFSAGVGGKGVQDWRDVRLHYRRFITGTTFADVFAQTRVDKARTFTRPGYLGVGITRMF
ncbi:hypothetical protein HY992_06370 [Candidatus Micrarchaeota archaeon]|nr:hypothetical protein [Candidatus Micrarchaeota archaeon]